MGNTTAGRTDAVRPYRTHPHISRVRLLPGSPFHESQLNMLRFLARQDTDSLLYSFRKAAGLPTGGAEPMTGWDAEDCKLRGHTTGHYLSAVSLAYAVSGDETYKRKAEAIVTGLAKCQRAMEASGKVHKGFLSAYDEEQFDLLEKLTKYPDIWAPYYTLDKIMSGLLDAYELAGIPEARDVAEPVGDWVYERLSKLPADLRRRMWDTYIAGEYGGMTGTLVRLYRISGREEHLSAAELFENEALLGPLRKGLDKLDSMHANQHIPQISGALELYAAEGSRENLDIVRNFESIVTGHHCYSIGGTGEEERFRAADSECAFLTEKTAESCASVNMLRLTARLFEYEEHARCELMDYYELTLFNHILMSHSHCDDGGTTYFMPLAPGSCKHYETEENSCCHGTGMESRFRFITDIYSYEGEGEDSLLRVDLPVPAVLDDKEKVTVSFAEDGRLAVRADADMSAELAVRIPVWARESFPEAADGYMYCGRLRAGESVSFDLPMKLRTVTAASESDYYNLAWGPYLLAAVSGASEFMHPEVSAMSELLGAEKGTFTDGAAIYRPLYRIDKEKYQIYFRKVSGSGAAAV